MVAARHEQIVSFLRDNRFGTVRELSQVCRVSEVTIRRDLDRLQEEGYVARQFGGAVLRSESPEPRSGSGEHENPCWILNAIDTPVPDLHLLRRDHKHLIVLRNREGVYRELGARCGTELQESGLARAGCHIVDAGDAESQSRVREFRDGVESVGVLLDPEQSDGRTAGVYFAPTKDGLIEALREASKTHREIVVCGPGDPAELARFDPIVPKRLTVVRFPELEAMLAVQACAAASIHAPHDLTGAEYVLDRDMLSAISHQRNGQATIDINAAARTLGVTVTEEALHAADTSQTASGVAILTADDSQPPTVFESEVSRLAARAGMTVVRQSVATHQERAATTRRTRIARAALDLLEPGNVIILNHGALTGELPKLMDPSMHLTAITNSVPVFLSLSENPGVNVISMGGELRRPAMTLAGDMAEASLREVRADKFFLDADGLSVQGGITSASPIEARMLRQMTQAARQVVVLIQSGRIGSDSVVNIAPLSAASVVVTDGMPSSEVVTELARLNIHLVVADA